MKAKIEALNKSYLVEFKDEDQFVSFLTQHNDKINNVEIINEESLPELQKPVEVAQASMSDGWKTLEKSAFTQKEKGVEKKGMTLGGKYAEFKYEPDKTLDNAADDKVSTPKSDSPALTGDEPKVADVEATAKEAEVEIKDAPKTEEHDTKTPEEHKEWHKEHPEHEHKEEKSEDKEEKKEDTEEKEEVKEAANPDMAVKEKLKDILDEFSLDSDLCFDIFDCMSPESQQEYLNKNGYEDIGYAYDDNRELAYDLVDFMNSEDLAKCKVMIEKWKAEEDEDLEEVFKAAGVQLDEGLFDAMKNGFKKVSDAAKKAAIAGTIALAVLTGTGAAQAAEEPEYRTEQIQIIDGNGEKQVAEFKIYEDGSAIDEYGNAFSESQLEDLKQGKDPYGV